MTARKTCREVAELLRRVEGALRTHGESLMRSANVAAFSILITLTSVSVGYAQTDQSQPSSTAPRGVTGNPPPQRQEPIPNFPSVEQQIKQENAAPYQPCVEALGWVNGRLRCRN
jgi:hypothetical protein